jgi:hypothetical protein
MIKIFCKIFLAFSTLISLSYCQMKTEYFSNSSKCNSENIFICNVWNTPKTAAKTDIGGTSCYKKDDFVQYSEIKEDTILRKKGNFVAQVGLEGPIIHLYMIIRSSITNSLSIGINAGPLAFPLIIDAYKVGLNVQKYIRPNDHMSGYFELNSGLIWDKINYKGDLNGFDLSLSFGLNWFSKKGLNTDLYVGGRFIQLKEHLNGTYPFLGVRFGTNIFNY